MSWLKLLLCILVRQILKNNAVVVGHLSVPKECWSGLVWNVVFPVASLCLVAIFLLWLMQNDWFLPGVYLASITIAPVVILIGWSLAVDFLNLNNFVTIDLSSTLLTFGDFEVKLLLDPGEVFEYLLHLLQKIGWHFDLVVFLTLTDLGDRPWRRIILHKISLTLFDHTRFLQLAKQLAVLVLNFN